MEYTKIHSLYKREGFDKESTQKSSNPKDLILGDYACPEFSNIKRWHVEEKIDGTNIRVIYSDGKVTFGGRTKDASIPASLFKHLQETFSDYMLDKIFHMEANQPYPDIILYGEGYGPKIQKGGENYREDVGFILFDVLFLSKRENGERVINWWLRREDVMLVAKSLGIPMCPFIGIMTEEEIVEYVKSKPKSLCSLKERIMEGVVCRSEPLMLFRDRKPIMFKLKCKDFK